MFPKAVSHLASVGLTSLASSIMDGIVSSGLDAVQGKIKDVTGLDINLNSEPTEEQVEALRSNQSSIAEELEQRVKLAEIELKDVEGARQQGKEMRESTSVFTRHFLEVFTIILTVGSMIFFYLTLTSGKSTDPLIATMMQFVFSIDMLVIGFWFGSSKGSKDKTEAMLTSNTNNHIGEEDGFLY